MNTHPNPVEGDNAQPPAAATRRQALGWLSVLGASGAATLAASEAEAAAESATEAALDDLLVNASSASCVITATETAGPYPLVSVLDNQAIVRKRITEGKTGIPLVLKLRLLDHDNGCKPLKGAAVYIWHCDASGEYSGYSSTANGSHSGETYLRGVQLTNQHGVVKFRTIFPGWYIPRLTHIHVQVFLADTTLSSSAVSTATTQLCFPDDITTAAYQRTELYAKGQNTVTATAADDQVFGNGVTTETLTVLGDVNTALHAGIVIGISASGSSSSSESGDSR